MELHIDYEKQEEYPLEQIENPSKDVEVSFRVERMKLSKDKSEIRYNDFLTLRGIPAAAFDYRLGNRSALEWVIDQYRVSTDPRSGIVNDPNREDDPKYRWLHEVASLNLFAVRRGILKFRGYERKRTRNVGPLTDADFKPQFEQKGVDMRIGLDIAAYSTGHLADRVILITNDTDCVPAMKFARKEGLQTVLIKVDNCTCAPELIEHADFKRPVPYV